VLAWVFGEHHAPTAGELDRFKTAAGAALFTAGFLWLAYVAVEPFVRRRWPRVLVAWNRLLAGEFRDPLVGRDLLAGCVLGVVWVLLNFLSHPVARWLGVPNDPQAGVGLGTMYLISGPHAILAAVSGLLLNDVVIGFITLVVLFLLRALLRSTAAAATIVVLILAVTVGKDVEYPLFFWSLFALMFATVVCALIRFGPIAWCAEGVFGSILLSFPITPDLSAWYFGIGLTGLFLALALALYGFYTSLGGQPLFGRASLGD
jgi:serine/threonine-protein kinase